MPRPCRAARACGPPVSGAPKGELLDRSATPIADLLTRGRILGALALLVFTFLVYAPALDGDFLWDDRAAIPENESLRSIGGLWEIWSDPGASADAEQHYPVTYSSFWVEYRLWGARPAGYHVVNVLLHVLNALLVWLLLQRLAVPGGGIAAWLFALHPVHVESVAWIVERKDLLSATFYLLSALAYLKFDREGRRPAYVASLLFFGLGLLSKTMVLSLPLALLLWVWWKKRRVSWADVRPIIPFFVLAALMFLIAFQLLVNPATLAEREAFATSVELSAAQRLLVAGRAVCFYVSKLVWPVELRAIYPKWEIDPTRAWQWIFPALVGVTLGVLVAARRSIGKGAAAAALFYCITLGPALGFVTFYLMDRTYVADRFQYLASFGLISLAAAGLAPRLAAERKVVRAAAWLGCAALVVILGGLSLDRARVYRNMETLIVDSMKNGAENPRGHFLIATFYEKEDRPDLVIRHFRRTIELDPDYYGAYNNLGRHLLGQGRLAEAEQLYSEAIRRFPTDRLGRNNLAVVYANTDRLDAAIVLLKENARLHPDDRMTRVNLGYFLMQRGERAAAAEQFNEALRIDPGAELARRGLEQATR